MPTSVNKVAFLMSVPASKLFINSLSTTKPCRPDTMSLVNVHVTFKRGVLFYFPLYSDITSGSRLDAVNVNPEILVKLVKIVNCCHLPDEL